MNMARSGPTYFVEVCRAEPLTDMTPHDCLKLIHDIAYDRLQNLSNLRQASESHKFIFSFEDDRTRFIHPPSPVQPHSRLESKPSLQGMQREAPLAYQHIQLALFHLFYGECSTVW